jgi:predicted DNA-binding transcriptional regulator YafY
MNQTERLYRIHQIIEERGTVSFRDLLEALEISRATLRRDLTHLRDRLHAPLVYDRDSDGYRFESGRAGPRYQLPGLWFAADEILALMTMHRLLGELDGGGLLGAQIHPLIARLTTLLESAEGPAEEILRRVRLIWTQRRRANPRWFQLIGSALVSRRRLRIDYYTRSRDERAQREVSPLRLMHYRNNWYLDAWCHRSDAIRMFSVDAIEGALLLDTRAKDVSLARVDEELGAGYGIYRRTQLGWARLRFNAAAARWVRDEVWHEKQKVEALEDGGLDLSVPFTDMTELAMDVLRHGENVQVLEPPELREAIAARLQQAARQYADQRAP